jgi:hypothetical protein
MDHWYGLVAFAVLYVTMVVVGFAVHGLWRRRHRLAEPQRQQGEPVGQPSQMAGVRAPASGEVIRCVLYEFAPGLKRFIVAIDIGLDAIWVRQSEVRTGFRVPVFDPNASALVASAPRAQVTATPGEDLDRYDRLLPILMVHVPGLKPLTIQPGWGSRGERFYWRGEVPRAKSSFYVTPDEDWLTLVEKFGLAEQLQSGEKKVRRWYRR